MLKLLENVVLYHSPEAGKQQILIGNGKIEMIATKIDLGNLPVERIDGKGKIAMPGYLDQHVHITGGGGEGGPTTKIPELGLSSCIEAGVTTIVGLLGTDGTTRNVEALLTKTKALREEGITAFCLTGSYDYPSPTMTGSVKRDIIFLEEVIGVKLAISDHRSSYPTVEELIKTVAASSQAALIGGKPGFVHIHMGTGKQGLQPVFDALEQTDIPITFFRPTHVRKIVEDAVRFAKMGGYIDLTASAKAEMAADTLQELLEKGAPAELITISSDSNGSSPKWGPNNEYLGIGVSKMTSLHTLTRELMNRGVSLSDAIQYTTVNVAKALGLYPAKGRLEVGCDGDILLLDEEYQIDAVFALGKKMMWDKKVLVSGIFESI